MGNTEGLLSSERGLCLTGLTVSDDAWVRRRPQRCAHTNIQEKAKKILNFPPAAKATQTKPNNEGLVNNLVNNPKLSSLL